MREKIGQIFPHDPLAGRTLAVLGRLGDAGTSAAVLAAARDAVDTGRLVAVGPGQGLAGLWATLHAEHPSIDITAVRAPLTAEGMLAARRVAPVPAGYRELVIGPDGAVLEPVMVPACLGGEPEFPLGPGDVVLVSRASGYSGLALVRVLACAGAAVVVVGSERGTGLDDVTAELERLRGAGAPVETAEVEFADFGAMVSAVRRIESGLGHVTALCHAVGSVPHRALTKLADRDVHEELRKQTAPLDQLAAAVKLASRSPLRRPGTHRLILTCGSAAGRYGVPGGALLALAGGALAEHGARLAREHPGCRAVHVDWAPWAEEEHAGEAASGSGAGVSAGATPRAAGPHPGYDRVPAAAGTRLLLKALSTPSLPGRLAVHGRVGRTAPRQIAAVTGPDGDSPRGRFIERVLVHYPGVELVAEATLSLSSDPYLGDYRLDGMPVLPPTMAIEAMAQAATALAGVPLRAAARVAISAPVVLSAGVPGSATVLRICALRDADRVDVVLRSDNSDFAVDHCLASFCCPSDPQARPGLPGLPVPADRAGRPARSPSQARPEAGQAAPRHAGEPGDGCLDGSELYGSVCFQAGRFRRLRSVQLRGSGAASALAYGKDQLAWFRPADPAKDLPGRALPPLLLGSAGLGDAALQLVQACSPHRRLVFAGCESVSFSGREPIGMVTIRALKVQVPDPGGPSATGPGARRPWPARRPEPAWDVEAVDATGESLVTWRLLRMRDVGPLPRFGAWPAALLGCYLEHAAADLGLGADLRVQVTVRPCASPGTWLAAPRPARDPGPGPGRESGTGLLEVRVTARGPASCGWRQANLALPTSRHAADAGLLTGANLHGRDGARGGRHRSRQSWLSVLEEIPPPLWQPDAVRAGAGPATAKAAGLMTALAAALGACTQHDSPPADVAASSRHLGTADWLLLRAGEARIACAALDVAGIGPVAFALMTGALATDRGTSADRAPRQEPTGAWPASLPPIAGDRLDRTALNTAKYVRKYMLLFHDEQVPSGALGRSDSMDPK